MRRSTRITAGALGAGIVVSSFAAPEVRAHLDNFYWSAPGHTLQYGSNSNMVGFWQTVGYTQVICPGGYYDGVYGSNTTAQTQQMQVSLPTPGVYVPATGVVDAHTWNAVEGAWAQAPGTANNFTRLSPLGPGQINGTPGNYGYYGGSGGPEASLAWGNSGGPTWKFQVYGTSSWFNASTGNTMGSTSAC